MLHADADKAIAAEHATAQPGIARRGRRAGTRTGPSMRVTPGRDEFWHPTDRSGGDRMTTRPASPQSWYWAFQRSSGIAVADLEHGDLVAQDEVAGQSDLSHSGWEL